MTTNTTRTRVLAELAVSRGEITEALLIVEQALLSAPPESRPDLEQAREQIADAIPSRPSWPPARGEA